MVAIEQGDALIVVDVQKDFLPGGSLAVPGGGDIIPLLNHYLALAADRGIPTFVTRDWHPAHHCSFREQGGPWPPHCVAESPGAEFPRALQLPPNTTVISKGTDPDRDAYSAFDQTDLDARLRSLHVRRVLVGGLATDYCVRSTVHGALNNGYRVVLLEDAIRAVNVRPEDGEKARLAMLASGVVPACMSTVS